MKNSGISFFLLGLFLCNHVKAQYTTAQFAGLYYLKGTWKMITKKGSLVEIWKIEDDSTMFNKSYRINGADTVPQETVVLKIRNGVISYTSIVADQNNQQSVSFILVDTNDGKYVFENKAHDFPQQIFYKQTDHNSLHAGIAGTVQNSYREIPFNYTRE